MVSHLTHWQVRGTLAVMILSVTSSLLGLFRVGHYTGATAVLGRTRTEDAVILLIGVPVLAVGVWYAHRGSSRGRIVWLGSLTFMTYLWLTRAGSMAFNDFFLGYVLLSAVSVFTLSSGMATTDTRTVHRTLEGRLSTRLFTAVLGVTAVGLAALWVSDILPATLTGTTPGIILEFGPLGMFTYVVDLGLVVPAYAITAYGLLNNRHWAFVTTGVLLVFGGLLAPGLAAILVVDLQQGVAMTPGMIIGTVLPPVLVGVFAVKYLLALTGRPRSTSPDSSMNVGGDPNV